MTVQNGKNVFKDGTIKYFRYEKLHNTTGPAVIHPNGDFEFWFDGRRCNTKKLKNGYYRVVYEGYHRTIYVKTYNKEGELDSFDDRPAIISRSLNDYTVMKEWFCNGKHHRENKPAFILHRSLFNEKRFRHGYRYIKHYEMYFQNDKKHNENGAAEIYYTPDIENKKVRFDYYLNDRLISKNEWQIKSREYKIKNIFKK